ncbi:MAG: translation elongation factor 4 [Fimbriimonadia bacterium]|nr:translation elongation factor 4 [Fimbriimonadia bacterium]
MDQSLIRNFCIIAHVDHGKSTLADRLMEATGALQPGNVEQALDTMDLERERGITIKMTAVRLHYKASDGKTYQLNLIDTPGHVDFTYEVSRSLAACEGALLVVDASQGVEAQTIANTNLAMVQGLQLIPVMNKIDLPAAEPERVNEEIEHALMMDASEVILASAKEGIGIQEILEAVVHRVPPPVGDEKAAMRALVYDSHYDTYVGVVAYVRVVDGAIKSGTKIRFMQTGKEYEVSQVGYFTPRLRPVDVLRTGEVGYIIASIKTVHDAPVGDTITDASRPSKIPLPGFRRAKPMVFCGLYPVEGDKYADLRDALEKLQLNDAAITFEPENSVALGFGFRCGFLGLLHMEIIQERLEREFSLELIATAPSVVYRVLTEGNEWSEIDNPTHWPPSGSIRLIEEPFVNATVMVPKEYVGTVMELCMGRRGEYVRMEYPTPQRAILYYKLPLSEILLDFFDQLKSRTRGYASFDYELGGYRPAEMVKLDILINGDVVDALSFIAPKDRSYPRARALVERLKEVVPRQQFEVRIQAAIGSKVIAAENIKPFRKNVIAKCYGGDITRKRKLLERQKEGKKRMKQVGSVEVPQEAFLSVLKVGD